MESSICLLNATATGTETLKNLVLPGCGNITIIDPLNVTENDLGNNFFVDPSYLGQPRSKAALELLLEMNDDVKGTYIQRSITDIIQETPEYFHNFTLVIATQLPTSTILQLANILYPRNIPLLVIRSYGLIGYLRIIKAEHTIIESKLETARPDLRIRHPWKELRQYVDNINLSTIDEMTHGHVPYVVLLIKALDLWRISINSSTSTSTTSTSDFVPSTNNLRYPSTFAEKKAFREILHNMRRGKTKVPGEEANFDEAEENPYHAFAAPIVSSDTRKVLDDECATNLTDKSSNFWFIVRAIRDFVDHEGALPLCPTLPDMTATSELYIQLQNLYSKKAEEDVQYIMNRIHELRTNVGLSTSNISIDDVRTACRNAYALRVLRYRSYESEMNSSSPLNIHTQEKLLQELSNTIEEITDMGTETGLDEDGNELPVLKLAQQKPISWYLMLRAIDRFYDHHNYYPGTSTISSLSNTSNVSTNSNNNDKITVEADSNEVWNNVLTIMNELNISSQPLSSLIINTKHAQEITRYGNSELHTIAAFMGGVASQEAVKLLTSQYLPFNNTFIYNGIAGTAGVMEL